MNGTALPASIGKFQVVEFLGQGAMGRVYLGEDPHIGRRVAIKVMTTAGDDETRARFHNEAMAAGRLSHPNIVQVYEYGSFEEQPYLAMEYLEGERLDEWLRAERTPRQKLSVLLGLCHAVEHAHARGVLHRDIKPSNLQILPDGSCKLMDFGIARLESSKLTATGMILGTPEFIAPEVLQECAYSPQADCYAVGLVAYWTLSGHNPFSADSMHSCLHRVLTVQPEPLQALCPDLPEALCQAIDACLYKDPNLRPTNLQELMQALETVTIGSDPSLTATPTRVLNVPEETLEAEPAPATILAPPPKRTRLPGILAALVLLLTVLGVGYWGWSGSHTEPHPTVEEEADLGDPIRDTPVRTTPVSSTPVNSTPVRTTPVNNTNSSDTDSQLADAGEQPQIQSQTAEASTREPSGGASTERPPRQEPPRQEPPSPEPNLPTRTETQPPISAIAQPEPATDEATRQQGEVEPATAAAPPPTALADSTSGPGTQPSGDVDAAPALEQAPRTASQPPASPSSASPSSTSQSPTVQPPAVQSPAVLAPAETAEPRPALTLLQVTPAAVRRGQSTAVVLSATGFDANPNEASPSAVFRRGHRETRFLSLRGVRLRPDGSLTGTLFVGKEAPLGLYTVTVRDDSGRESNAVQVEVRL